MELITNIVIEYLKHNKRLVVPKLGIFIVKHPSGNILFSDLMRNDDGVLRSLLVAYGIKELEANGMMDRFVFEIRHATGMGESFNIEGLGEFCPAENNTIKFRHKREPMVIGGNIKPPVEVLNVQKRMLHKSGTHPGNAPHAKPDNTTERASRRGAKEEEQSNVSSIRPDDYLRGLKYDKDKKRRRGEDGSESRGRSIVMSATIVLLIAAAAFGCIWGIWQWTKDDNTYVPPQHEEVEENAIRRDTLVRDNTIDTLTRSIDTLDTPMSDNSSISPTM